MMVPNDDLVPGRECGGCTICCIEPAIAGHGLDKPAGVACRNCSAGGCAIYETRPPPCREFFCVWRRAAFVGEAWRPDLSGVMIAPATAIGGTPSGISVICVVNPRAHDVLETPAFANLVAEFVARGIGVFLNLPAAPGEPARESRLHDWVLAAVDADDPARVMAGIRDCYRQTMALPLP
ncbi:MAG: hypothetical protein ACKVOL_10130 [Novosphingobium sp.]